MNIKDNDTKDVRAKAERQKHVEAIINSPSKKKIVVAGPGTGKTYLFKEALKNKNNTLTLTFVNALVEDLSLELCGLSDVRTLHSYARSALASCTKQKVNIFPKLSTIISEDAELLLNRCIDFDHLFHNRDDKNEYISFYKKRKDYYDKHYGYSDIIFAIVKEFEKYKNKIPTYEQVLVDEFQDFNKLEVSLIDLLAEKSPVLIVGDDDQALYDFKDADAKHIRQRHKDKALGYAPFDLPYCSRCTRVIVDAVNDFISAATGEMRLKGRVKKEFKYFEAEEKDKESDQYQKIIYSQHYENRIPWFIDQQLNAIAKELREEFSVLIISPTKIKSRTIVDVLRNKGFKNIERVERKDINKVVLLDGLRILLKDKKSNLGWRIVSKFLMEEEEFSELINTTNTDEAKSIFDIIENKYKKEANRLLRFLRAVRDGKKIEDDDLDIVLQKIAYDPYAIAKDYIRDELVSESQHVDNPGIRKIHIKASTIQSSKGLAAEYVFITHFDNRYFIKDADKTNISDRDICNFIVALTRAKRKVFLISSNKRDPTFLKWINNSRIERIP